MSADVWRPTPLGEVLAEDRQRVAVEPDRSYPIAGVYGFGRGVLLREPVGGEQISASHLYRIASGQIIYSRLKAFEGAFALVPAEADGRYVSNEFPTFSVNRAQALPEFVALLLAVPRIWRELTDRSMGVGARRERLQVADFLEFEIDLPPLDVQRRIVTTVQAATELADAAIDEAEAANGIAVAIYAEAINQPQCRRLPLGELAELDLDRVLIADGGRYAIAGVAIAGQGLFWRDVIDGSSTTYERLHRLRAGQLVYRKLTAWEGPITVVSPEFDGAFVSPEFPTLSLNSSELVPDFMAFVCQLPSFHYEMRALSTGTAERRNRLKPADLLEIEVDVPPIGEQHRVAAAARLATQLREEAEVTRTVAAGLRENLLGDGQLIGDMP
jgi:type I restriction enzyme S subunit